MIEIDFVDMDDIVAKVFADLIDLDQLARDRCLTLKHSLEEEEEVLVFQSEGFVGENGLLAALERRDPLEIYLQLDKLQIDW